MGEEVSQCNGIINVGADIRIQQDFCHKGSVRNLWRALDLRIRENI